MQLWRVTVGPKKSNYPKGNCRQKCAKRARPDEQNKGNLLGMFALMVIVCVFEQWQQQQQRQQRQSDERQ